MYVARESLHVHSSLFARQLHTLWQPVNLSKQLPSCKHCTYLGPTTSNAAVCLQKKNPYDLYTTWKQAIRSMGLRQSVQMLWYYIA